MGSPVQYSPVSRVVIFGGTHGNEMSGVTLVKHWIKNPSELRRKTFTAEACLANPLAVERCVRYIDTDLNRCLSEAVLSAPESESDPYEFKRARELNQKYGSGSSQFDFIFDLHNTTSNMGATFLRCSNDEILSEHMANYLKSRSGSQIMPCYNFLIDVPKKDNVYLQNIGKHSLCLELGPQPHGLTRADVLTRMRELVNYGLDFLDLFNQGKEFPSFDTDQYRVLSRVDYPRDSAGEISAFIHSGLQDKDYVPLKNEDPIFTTLDGEDLLYEGDKVVYPTFINEAAYYEKKVAFTLTEKVRWKVPALKLGTLADYQGCPN
ncbi:N-acyl-aromatic-L-amino acid amidohydrolase (carboxylate-forming)-like [Hyla sarda]|uniref:N-acyl-aromatic-L-amino acid amidohydrolase (carboxylate-forming)-like n=1 Tax=Hyla sarda TaxID=327740 RepID=UPI0024C327E9|nr:N-acyl-aromatic-L-amino acid amidohydrolase (carboxylate-forming)-like [Hyla sarda]XP_056412754.1 N-acyl-aromatic-L-amino acid amidohydrolase (carboxylate-forming)-like [Hyla sarda]XP_056412755.1 N-acyl-aromatic-L-amino acid amidohydrolase (carboxylate-forming)-like [Hyla sarda]